MAASSMKDIKLRIKSVESTMQITKAMELVASSKLQRAKERAERTRPYFTTLHETLCDIAYANTDFSSPFVKAREVKKSCFVIVAGDRGLAGGYNSNVFKKAASEMEGKNVCVVPIGKKALEYCKSRGYEILSADFPLAEAMDTSESFALSRMLCKAYCEGKFDELYLVYTNFVSMLSQQPAALKVLPIRYEKSAAKDNVRALMQYAPSSEAVYNAIAPEYVGGLLYGAMAESIASEMGARRTAMDAASKNAGEMIEDLSLKYNRARQGAITQEITEIVAGAEA